MTEKNNFPCLNCGKNISREKSYCLNCSVELSIKHKYDGIKIKCDWCKKEKTYKSYCIHYLSSYSKGEKTYCRNCHKKYHKKIAIKTRKIEKENKIIEAFFKKKKNKECFEWYLSRATNDILKIIKKIDIDSYYYALRIKDNMEKEREKRVAEYKENTIIVNYKKYNLKTAPPEFKPVIDALLLIRTKKNYIKEVRNNG